MFCFYFSQTSWYPPLSGVLDGNSRQSSPSLPSIWHLRPPSEKYIKKIIKYLRFIVLKWYSAKRQHSTQIRVLRHPQENKQMKKLLP
jgi:hypothetical protein